MELRQLHYFVTLADELHFRRAAERMHIAQPAFSEQIRRLEGELGAKLFERTSHYVRLTEAGRLFLAEIRPALAQVEQAAAVAARAGRGVFGTLTLGLAAAALSELTPMLMREFSARCPEIAIEVREYGFTDPSAGLAAREVDVALLRLPVPAQYELEVMPLLDEPRVAVMAADHPLADAILVTAEDLAGELLVTGPRAAGTRRRRPLEPIADTLESWLSLIAAGRGIGLAPASMARLYAREGLRFIAVAGLADTTLAIGHHREGTAPAVTAFVELARSMALRADRARRPARDDRGVVSRQTDLALVAGRASGQD